MGTRGGQANEAGSVFRRSVAIHLAVRGLLGRPVPSFGASNGTPIALEFEVQDDVDDILCRMSVNTAAYISAKRIVGDDRNFRSTIDAWARHCQRSDDCDDDLLVLATSSLRGAIRLLPDALDRRRSGLVAASRGEMDALQALDVHLASYSRTVRSKILSRSRILIVRANENGLSDHLELGESLEGTLVPHGSGASAIDLLAANFHQQAAAASGSAIDDWIRIIKDGLIPVYIDMAGPQGARIAAQQMAVEQYRYALVRAMNTVDLALLADDLPPLKIEDMADSLRAEIAGSSSRASAHNLIHIVRRWRRFVLFGLPGAGKSTALREVAGWLATSEEGPIPVMANLTALAAKPTGGIITNSHVFSLASELISPELRPALLNVLEAAAVEGNVTFLLDGLDECGDRAAWVIDQINSMLEALPLENGLILATRHSARIAAGKLRLQSTTLLAPKDLSSTLDRVLQSCADCRVVENDRMAWVRTRQAWLKAIQSDHQELFQVPLLAVLLTLVAAASSVGDLPSKRATLLFRAISDSIERWEMQRHAKPQLPNSFLGRRALLAGYKCIGELLGSSAPLSRSQAVAGLVELFAGDRWRLSPIESEAYAEGVVRFWDEQVGVFVENPEDGTLESRSRVFIDVARATATLQLTAESLRSWVEERIDELDSDTLQFALGMNDKVVDAVLELGDGGSELATLLLAKVADDGEVNLSTDQMNRLVQQLVAEIARNGVRAAEQPIHQAGSLAARSKTRGSKWSFLEFLRQAKFISTVESQRSRSTCWPLVLALVSLRLDGPDQRAARDTAVAQAALPADLLVIARAVSSLRDVNQSQGRLSEGAVASVQAALDLPLPPEPRVDPEARTKFGNLVVRPLADGLSTIALEAVTYLDQFQPETAAVIFKIGCRAEYGGRRIRLALAEAEVDTTQMELEQFPDPTRFLKLFASEDDLGPNRILEDLVGIGESDIPLGRDQNWTMSAIGDLLDVCQYQVTGMYEHRLAYSEDPVTLRRRWLNLLARVYRLDANVVRAQARKILASPSSHELLNVVFVPSPYELEVAPGTLLRSEDEATVLDCLAAESNWIAASAAGLIVTTANSLTVQQILDVPVAGRWMRTTLLYRLAAVKSDAGDGTMERFAVSPDFRCREAAAGGLRYRSLLDQASVGMLARLAEDEDLTVRIGARGPNNSDTELAAAESLAAYWSCLYCGQRNSLIDRQCTNCVYGSIPAASDPAG
jgi:hypothetical protein